MALSEPDVSSTQQCLTESQLASWHFRAQRACVYWTSCLLWSWHCPILQTAKILPNWERREKELAIAKDDLKYISSYHLLPAADRPLVVTIGCALVRDRPLGPLFMKNLIKNHAPLHISNLQRSLLLEDWPVSISSRHEKSWDFPKV